MHAPVPIWSELRFSCCRIHHCSGLEASFYNLSLHYVHFVLFMMHTHKMNLVLSMRNEQLLEGNWRETVRTGKLIKGLSGTCEKHNKSARCTL